MIDWMKVAGSKGNGGWEGMVVPEERLAGNFSHAVGLLENWQLCLVPIENPDRYCGENLHRLDVSIASNRYPRVITVVNVLRCFVRV